MRTIVLYTSLLLATTPVAGLAQTFTKGDWSYTLNASNQATITRYSGSSDTVEIPSTIDSYPVRQVGDDSDFIFPGGAASVAVPEGVTRIGSFAFTAIVNRLTNVTLPSSLQSIGNSAFLGCQDLHDVVIPDGVTNIGASAFSGCGLTRVVIPHSVTSMGLNAFSGGGLLTNVVLSILRTSFTSYFENLSGDAFSFDVTPLAGDLDFVSALSTNEAFVSAVATNEAFITALAHKIVGALPNNYGIATKSDLGTVVSNTVSQIQSNPTDYNLFTLAQNEARYNEGVTAGTSLVTANPGSYSLYTSNSIMDLAIGALMIQKQGTNATVVFQTQSTTDLATLPFTNNGTPITNTVPMPGNKGFLRVRGVGGSSPGGVGPGGGAGND